jgi:hypothetical protein
MLDIARSLSEVAVRVANEQIKCRVSEETRCKDTTFPQITKQNGIKFSKNYDKQMIPGLWVCRKTISFVFRTVFA